MSGSTIDKVIGGALTVLALWIAFFVVRFVWQMLVGAPRRLSEHVEGTTLLVGLVAATLLTCGAAFADVNSVANNVLKYSDSNILSAGKDMAEAVAANAPVRVDKITLMLGAVFVRQTKTFIYKYETSQALDSTVDKPYLARHTCADPIRKAFMYRGVVFRHSYVTPSGQRMFDVRYSDC